MNDSTSSVLSKAFSGMSAVAKLKAEVELLTRCTRDTVYRLRYDTMRYDYISPAVEQLLGYTVQELMKANLRDMILETRIVSDGLRVVQSYLPLEENRKRGEVSTWQADYLMKTKDGKEIWVSDISYPWFDENGAIVGSMGSLRDITDRILAEQKVRQGLLDLVSNDLLTALPTRQMFWGKLEDEIKRLKRTHSELSLLLIDIDQFYKVNEAYGYDVGDTVISSMAKLIRSCLRDVDLPARLGGEEFGVILPETGSEGAVRIAERIRNAIAKHTFFAGSQSHPIGCTVSIGVGSTRFGQHTDATYLYKLADMRLYVAKHAGMAMLFSDDELSGNMH